VQEGWSDPEQEADRYDLAQPRNSLLWMDVIRTGGCARIIGSGFLDTGLSRVNVYLFICKMTATGKDLEGTPHEAVFLELI
jgi:hypothetical protein